MVLLIVLGLGVGLISSLLGVGGGVIVVPALFALFPHAPPQVLVGSCLFFIFIASLVNMGNFWKWKIRPAGRVLWPMMAFNIAGVLAGGLLTKRLDAETIRALFALFISMAAMGMLWRSMRKAPPENDRWLRRPVRVSLTGLTGGLVSGLTGLGGGGVMVPLLIGVVKIPPRKVSLYSNCVMAVGSLVGSAAFFGMESLPAVDPALAPFRFGRVNAGIALLIALGSMVTSPLGVALSQKIPQVLLYRLFAALLLSMGLKTLTDIW